MVDATADLFAPSIVTSFVRRVERNAAVHGNIHAVHGFRRQAVERSIRRDCAAAHGAVGLVCRRRAAYLQLDIAKRAVAGQDRAVGAQQA